MNDHSGLLQLAAQLREDYPAEFLTPGTVSSILEQHASLSTLRNDADEWLPLVDPKGNDLYVSAPRWLCHLLGWRHRCVHIVLTWEPSPDVLYYVLQMRSFSKTDSPGKLDIIGGHVKSDESVVEAARNETYQEIGIPEQALTDGLLHITGYAYERNRPEANFYNCEWRDIFHGQLRTDQLKNIRFRDGEVAGLFLCPEHELHHLLQQDRFTIASALECSVREYLKCSGGND